MPRQAKLRQKWGYGPEIGGFLCGKVGVGGCQEFWAVFFKGLVE